MTQADIAVLADLREAGMPALKCSHRRDGDNEHHEIPDIRGAFVERRGTYCCKACKERLGLIEGIDCYRFGQNSQYNNL